MRTALMVAAADGSLAAVRPGKRGSLQLWQAACMRNKHARDNALRQKLAGHCKAVFAGAISWYLCKDVRCSVATIGAAFKLCPFGPWADALQGYIGCAYSHFEGRTC